MAFLTRVTHAIRSRDMQQLMDDQGLDALVLFTEGYFQYATNFHVDVRIWERPIAVIVQRNGEAFALMHVQSAHHINAAHARGTLWIDDIDLYVETLQVDHRLPMVMQFPEMLIERLRSAGLARSRIGVDAMHPSLARVSAALPELRVFSPGAALKKLRWVKTQEELTIMREACDLADWVQERYRENIRPGRLCDELDLQMESLMVTEGARRFPGENLEVLRCWTLSGAASASPHGLGAPTGARIESGDILINLVIPRLNGLVVENERTWFAGKPDAQRRKLYETSRDANEAAIAAAMEGRPVSDIDAAAQRVIESAGLGRHVMHRTGHGMGIAVHEYPEDMPFCHRPLLRDEVYSVEPGIYVEGVGGARIDDTIIINGDTPEVLTHTPKTVEYATID